jgi:hypothetical protein
MYFQPDGKVAAARHPGRFVGTGNDALVMHRAEKLILLIALSRMQQTGTPPLSDADALKIVAGSDLI